MKIKQFLFNKLVVRYCIAYLLSIIFIFAFHSKCLFSLKELIQSLATRVMTLNQTSGVSEYLW